MAATGRSYYPNIPGPLEQALAPSVADGTSVWGPLMMMSARHERQQAYDDVNETQAQQFLLGLQGALDQAGVKARADILGQMARGGHMGGAMMRAANEGGLGTFDPNDIATQTLLGNAGELAGVGKTIGEAENAGAQGGNTPDLSQLAAGLGMPLTKSAPLGVQEHNIAAEATRYAADRGLEGKVYSADHKTAKTTAPKQDTVAVSGPYGTVTHYLKPGELSPDAQRAIEGATQNAQVAIGSASQSDINNPTQDPAEKDPGWAEQMAALIASRHTNPVFVKRTTQGGKKGKMVEVDDPSHPGQRTVKFVSDPVQ